MKLQQYLFTHKTIALQADAADWQAAVAKRSAHDLLERAGAVEARYYDGILDNVRLTDLISSLCRRWPCPTRGRKTALATGFSLVTLAQPVAFGHPLHDPVNILMVISAADRKCLNEEVIVELMTLLDCDQCVARLRKTRTLDDLRQLFADLPQEAQRHTNPKRKRGPRMSAPYQPEA